MHTYPLGITLNIGTSVHPAISYFIRYFSAGRTIRLFIYIYVIIVDGTLYESSDHSTYPLTLNRNQCTPGDVLLQIFSVFR